MRPAIRWRSLGALAAVFTLVSACGGNTSPTMPEMPVVIATGPQVLRITYQGPCTSPDGRAFLPFLYTRVVVSRSGSEWIAVSATPDAGNLQLRFHLSGIGALSGSAPVEGTIAGTAIHSPDLLPSLPPTNARANFGNDGRTAVSGFAFSPSSLTPAAGVSGIGSGTITLTDGERSCTGSTFMWGLGPQS